MGILVRSSRNRIKFVKSWLNLPRNCTPGTVFHPDVLNLPFLPHLKESAKLSYILAVERSVDPLIVELRHSVIATSNYPDTSPVIFDYLQLRLRLPTFVLQPLKTMHIIIYALLTLNTGTQALPEPLTVQNKF